MEVDHRKCANFLTRREKTMKNCEMKLEGDMLIIKVDLSKEFGRSASGKT